MSDSFSVAIIGATGIVGNEILQILEERDFPIKELRLLASERSEGEVREYKGDQIIVHKLDRDSFDGIDLALFCAGDAVSEEYCTVAASMGAVCIDTSGVWGLDTDVPLVVPEVNADDLADYSRKNIVATPLSSTIQLVLALKPLHELGTLKRVVVSTYQSVSGAGRKAIDELRVQSGELLNGRPVECKVFPHQVAFNCLPHIGPFLPEGDTLEEMKIVKETQKLLGEDSVHLTATAVRIPVFYGNSLAVNIETVNKVDVLRVREILASSLGVELIDEPENSLYPMTVDAAGQDPVMIGRIREDVSIENGLNLWIVADNLRKGAATNVVQIAEILADRYL